MCRLAQLVNSGMRRRGADCRDSPRVALKRALLLARATHFTQAVEATAGAFKLQLDTTMLQVLLF